MSFSILLSEEAEEDIYIAYQWYEDQRVGPGDEFTASLNSSFSSILSVPENYGFKKNSTRGCILSGFPYIILFLVKGTNILIISVFHTSRGPIL